MKTPVVKDVKGLWASESAVLWAKVNEGILNKSWDKAMDAKTTIEDKEREVVKKIGSQKVKLGFQTILYYLIVKTKLVTGNGNGNGNGRLNQNIQRSLQLLSLSLFHHLPIVSCHIMIVYIYIHILYCCECF